MSVEVFYFPLMKLLESIALTHQNDIFQFRLSMIMFHLNSHIKLFVENEQRENILTRLISTITTSTLFRHDECLTSQIRNTHR